MPKKQGDKGSRLEGGAHTPEPDVRAPELGEVADPDCGAQALGRAVERPTAHHPGTAFQRSCRISLWVCVVMAIPIPAPLKDIAVHVKEPPGIRCLAAYRLSGTLTVGLVPGIAIQRALVVPAEKAALCPGAAGIFPFRLGGETVALGMLIPLYIVPIDPVTGTATLVLRLSRIRLLS